MKSALMWFGGFAAAAAGFILLKSRRPKPVVDLAHDLEVAWADHHTVV